MNIEFIKKFFRPSWGKILFFLIIAALINTPEVGYYKSICGSPVLERPPYECTKLRFYLFLALVPYNDHAYNPLVAIINDMKIQLTSSCHSTFPDYWYFSCILSKSLWIFGFIFMWFYWYFLSCLIISGYSKLKKARKHEKQGHKDY